MVNKKIKQKPRKKPGFKKVNFMSGLDTKTKLDDKQISFTARNRGKRSKLPIPSRAKALRNLGKFNTESRQPRTDLPLGLAEISGSEFDNVFGLGKKKDRSLFNSKIGLNLKFGKKAFDTSFSKGFVAKDLDFGESTMISDDFPEPSEMDFEDTLQDDVPSLLESLPNITDKKKIPLTDEDDDISKRQKLEKKFRKVRIEALETGGNPLTPEEELEFSQIKPTGQFGTGGRRGTGLGVGRL